MYENRNVSETIRGLQTDAERGLGAAQIAERRKKYGPNRLKDKEERSGGHGDFHDAG